MMSYIKQPHYAVNGLTLAGPGMDLLHTAVGYPGEGGLPRGGLHKEICTGGLHRGIARGVAQRVLHGGLHEGVWFKNRRAKCRQQQQQSSGQAKARPAKKKSSPPREAPPDAGGAGPYSPPPSVPSGTPSSAAGATVSIWSPASISPVPDPLATAAAPGLPRSAPFPGSYGQQVGGYGQSYPGSYFGGLDCGSYLSPMHPQLGAPGGALSPLGTPSMGAHHLAPSPAGLAGQGFGATGLGFGSVDCLDYKDQAGSWKLNFAAAAADCLDYKEQSSWKFQVL
uniref:Transcription factor Otx C-terminal domain-containing protein n=1 Tax=Anas zonorhyncha TaxID=75864 RepID=A0A8B9UB92_9AVES